MDKFNVEHLDLYAIQDDLHLFSKYHNYKHLFIML